MALVETGDALTSPEIQPGWTVSNDGFGLVTSTTKFKADHTFDIDALTNRGTAHPDSTYSFLKAHKYSVSWDALGIATVTVDYVGIDPDSNSGVRTNPNTSSANGLTSENITTHPNFFVAATGYSSVIAGTSYTQSPLGPMVEIKDVADWVSVNLGTNSDGTPQFGKVGKKQSYVGLNGACFESSNGGRFIGFVSPTYKFFYGKTNYLASQTAFSGHFYTSEQSTVQDAIERLNTSSSTNDWFGALPDIVPTYAGTSWISAAGYGQLLLSQVNIEDYGLLYKVNYEVRYNAEGWHSSVYRPAP